MTNTTSDKVGQLRNPDKLNRVDFHWFIVRTLPHQEEKLSGLLAEHLAETDNILEVYCPTHTTVSVMRGGKDVESPLFAGYVFVLSTQEALMNFINRYYPDGSVLYDRRKSGGRKAGFLVVPENQMRSFMDFNENYADKVIILEHPYSDYAFNPKTDEPNEIVRVIDGPLAGREGYIARFRRDKRLVFKMKALDSDTYYTVSVPRIWDFHVVRLHNAEGDRLSVGTEKGRAVDALVGILQSCGYGEKTLPMLYGMIDALVAKPSFVDLCRLLSQQGHDALSRRIRQLDVKTIELLLNLVRYEHDNPGYVKANWHKAGLRPFLTPVSGMEMGEGMEEAVLRHVSFVEVIRKVYVTEGVYHPREERGETVTETYYAHVGVVEDKENGVRRTLFANWDAFLGEYFQTAGKANERLVAGTTRNGKGETGTTEGEKERLIESFRNFAPTLYKVLSGGHPAVKVVRDFRVGEEALNVLALSTEAGDISPAKDELISTCVSICKEINTTTHLAVWRRYLRSVWLHV